MTVVQIMNVTVHPNEWMDDGKMVSYVQENHPVTLNNSRGPKIQVAANTKTLTVFFASLVVKKGIPVSFFDEILVRWQKPELVYELAYQIVKLKTDQLYVSAKTHINTLIDGFESSLMANLLRFEACLDVRFERRHTV